MPRLIVIEGHEGQRRQLEELIKSLALKGYPLTEKLEAASCPDGWAGVFASSGSGSLFSDRQVTVIEGAESFGPFNTTLSEYLEGEESDSVIIAMFSADTKKIFEPAILATKKILFIKAEAAVPPWKRKDWLLSLAKEKGHKIEPTAAALLGESLESLEELRSELDKLAVYSDGKAITLDDVKAASFDEGAKSLLTFLDGVCQANLKDVLRSLVHLQKGSASPLPVLTALYNRLRPALYIACFQSDASRALDAIGTPREYALRMARSALDNYGPEAIKKFMLGAIRCSFTEKTSMAEGWAGFEAILWQLKGQGRKT